MGLPGLVLYRPPSGAHWSEWPLLTINWDQESSNLAAAHWMTYSEHRLNIDFCWDPSHGGWNDVRLASKDACWFGWLLGLLLIFNLPHGPWQEDIRASQVSQMLSDIAGESWTTPPPLLMARSLDIIKESDRPELVSDPDAAQILWDEFRYNNAAFRRKGSKVCKWSCHRAIRSMGGCVLLCNPTDRVRLSELI